MDIGDSISFRGFLAAASFRAEGRVNLSDPVVEPPYRPKFSPWSIGSRETRMWVFFYTVNLQIVLKAVGITRNSPQHSPKCPIDNSQ